MFPRELIACMFVHVTVIEFPWNSPLFLKQLTAVKDIVPRPFAERCAPIPMTDGHGVRTLPLGEKNFLTIGI